MKMTWRYAQVLIDFEDDGEPCYSIMEVYFEKDNIDKPNGFCNARMSCIEDLELALKSLKKYEPIDHFYKTGKFSWDIAKGNYDYERYKEGETFEDSIGYIAYKRINNEALLDGLKSQSLELEYAIGEMLDEDLPEYGALCDKWKNVQHFIVELEKLLEGKL